MCGLKDNLVLIGFMGSGKSTIGIGLSYKLQSILTDTDKMIEKQEGKSISEIFAQEGEPYFREKETKLLKKLKQEKTRQIFSVGGGTPIKKENRKLLHELGIVVYLKTSPESVYERVKGDAARPLLQGENPMEKIRELLGKREDIYREAADIVIVTDGKKPTQIVEEILRGVQN